MKKQNKKSVLLTASLAGIVAVAGIAALLPGTASADSCYGVNACKGQGDCGAAGHSCAGKNGCKGQGSLELPKETCLKIQGGSLTALPQTS